MPSTTFSFVLIHTDDMHSHFEGSGPDSSLNDNSVVMGNNRVIGHYARLLSLIRKLKRKFKHHLLLDAGDWMMGTLFPTLSMSRLLPQIAPPELEFFRIAGYDATIFGNHEFDVFQEGILSILRRMNQLSGGLNYSIPIISSNLIVSNREKCGNVWNEFYDNEPLHVNRESNKRTGVFMVPHFTKTFRNENGTELIVGVIGTMGPSAALVSIEGRQPCFHYRGFNESTYQANLEDYSNHIYSLALDLKLGRNNSPKCHVVVALSHSGEPEDRKVAELIVNQHKKYYKKGYPKVAVDVHISSHSHNVYLDKVNIDQIHSVYIHQSGPYASNLGVLQLQYNFETQQVILENENVKVPLSNIVSDTIDRELYEKDHLGPLSSSPSLFETTGICFDCINGKTLLPIRIPLTNEIPMDREYRKQIGYYKELINKYILGESFKFKYETSLGQVDISQVNEKSQIGTIFSDLIYSELRSNQEKARKLISFLKNQTNFNSQETVSQNLKKVDDSSSNIPVYHSSLKNWRVSDIENVLLDNDFHMYWLPTDGLRTHITPLTYWNGSVLDLQFSDAYNFFSLGRLSSSVGDGYLPGESMEVYYLSHRHFKKVFLYSKLLTDLFNYQILAYCSSSSFAYKTRWWGIPLLIEDKIHKHENLSLFQTILRLIKNSLSRYYDFTIDGIPEDEYYDNFYSKPYQSIYSPEPLYGLVIPGWLLKFVSQTTTLSNGWLTVEFRDRYGRLIQPKKDSKPAKSETRALLRTSQNAIPFMDYVLFAESLFNKME